MAQDPFKTFKEQTAKALSKALAELGIEAEPTLDRAPEGMGDLAFPCFPLAKRMRKAPAVIAQEIASKMPCTLPAPQWKKVSSPAAA